MSAHETTATTPMLRVVSGTPTPDELAVLTAVLSAATSDPQAKSPTRPQRGEWNDPARQHRRPLTPGPNAWASYFR